MVLKTSLDIATKRANLNSEKYHQKIDELKLYDYSDEDILHLLRISDKSGQDAIEDAYNTVGIIPRDEFMEEFKKQNTPATMTDDQNQVHVFTRPITGYTRTDDKLEETVTNLWHPGLGKAIAVLRPVAYYTAAAGLFIITAVIASGCASTQAQIDLGDTEPGIDKAPDAQAPTQFGPPKPDQVEEKSEPVKEKPKTSEIESPGQLFYLNTPSLISGQLLQSYSPEDGSFVDKHILRGATLDLWLKNYAKIGKNDWAVRVYGTHNHDKLFRHLGSQGSSDSDRTLIGAGLYNNFGKALKDGNMFLVGLVAELSQQKFSSAKDTETGFAIGPSFRYIMEEWLKAEANIVFGQEKIRYGDRTKGKKDRHVQANAGVSIVEPNTGIAAMIRAYWERYNEEQFGTDWHLKNEGRVIELAFARKILGKDGGHYLAIQLGGYAGNHQIGNHTRLAQLGAYAELIYGGELDPETGKQKPIFEFNFGIGTERINPSTRIPGTTKAYEDHKVYGGVKIRF